MSSCMRHAVQHRKKQTPHSSSGCRGKMEFGHITLLTTGESLRFGTPHIICFCNLSSWSTYTSRVSISSPRTIVPMTALRSTMAPIDQHLFLTRTAEVTRLVTSLPPETRCSSASLLITQKQKTVSMSLTTPNLSPKVSDTNGIRRRRFFLRSNENIDETRF